MNFRPMKQLKTWISGALLRAGCGLAMAAMIAMAIASTGCAAESGGKITQSDLDKMAKDIQAKPPTGGGPGGTGTEIIRANDLLSVTFNDLPPTGPLPKFEDRVKDDGTITLPLNVKVVAAGKTAGMLQEEIHKLYVPRYYVRLTVAVRTEERFYFVGGEVRNPGRFPYANELTVMRAIASAAGFTEFEIGRAHV